MSMAKLEFDATRAGFALLLAPEEIDRRIAELGMRISEFYGDDTPLVVAVLNGAMLFCADLVRQMHIAVELDALAVSSYANNCSTGELVFRGRMKNSCVNRRVLLVDDILDTGYTLARLKAFLLQEGAAEVSTCVMLDKRTSRHPQGLAQADFAAFVVPERYIIGYGLDADERFRNLAGIWIKKL